MTTINLWKERNRQFNYLLPIDEKWKIQYYDVRFVANTKTLSAMLKVYKILLGGISIDIEEGLDVDGSRCDNDYDYKEEDDYDEDDDMKIRYNTVVSFIVESSVISYQSITLKSC